MSPQAGQVINNKYRLLRLIGDGGMGSVYEARHEVLGTSVALKFLHAELGKRPGLVQRFLQEARVSAQIQSPHVVRVTDVDQADSGAFIVMEYLQGKTLQSLYEELYAAGAQLSYPDALEYAMQMLEGVEAAHRSGIVHRDLKPDNVMITQDGKGRTLIKLLDFGIAKLRVQSEVDRGLTRPGVIMGTPEYMAPEQAFSADCVDARADIFSLGVIIFEMLAGRRPVGGDEPHQIAGAYLSGQIARLTDLAPEISPELADAVHHAMAPAAGDRWPTVGGLRDAMEPFAIAAKAPSVMPSASLSRVSLTPGVPSAVPKTLPPEAEPAPAAFAAGAPGDGAVQGPSSTSPEDPPTMSKPGERGPTPLGGFRPFEDGAAPAGEEAVAPLPMPDVFTMGETPKPPPQALAGPPFIPATRSVAPISAPRVDPAATALASPLSGLAPYAAGMEGPPSVHAGIPPVAMAPAPLPYLPPVVPSAAPRAQKRPGPLSSLPAILMLAAAVSAAVVGGVYVAQHRAKADDHEDPPTATVVPSTTVTADPPPQADPTEPPPSGPTAVAHPWKPISPSQPTKPPTKGSAGPVTPPAPSATGPRPFVIPSVLPPIPELPFDLPFGPGPRQEPPRDAPRGDQPRGRPAPPPSPPRGERMELHRGIGPMYDGADAPGEVIHLVRRAYGMLFRAEPAVHRAFVGPGLPHGRMPGAASLPPRRPATAPAVPGQGAGLASASRSSASR